MEVPNFTTGVFNQKRWPGAGDTDECWMLSDLMAIHSVAPWLRLPTVPQYRQAAGNPDKDGLTFGSLEHSETAIKALYPEFAKVILLIKNGSFAELMSRLIAGHPLSLSVKSGALPQGLQFGYTGMHRVAVFFNGAEIRIANPLARAHSRSKPISEGALQAAVDAHDMAGSNYIMLPTVEVAFARHPLHPQPSAMPDLPAPGIDVGGDDTEGMEDVAA